jgi:uncharacterized repeat protein (TIGR02543 family)
MRAMKYLIRSKQKKQGKAKLAGALGLLLALGLVISLVAVPVSAQPPPPPNNFFGLVTYQPSGTYVGAGAVVTAEVDDPADGWVEIASTLVFLDDGEAWYSFPVPGDNPLTPEKDGAEDYDEVRFYVDGVLAGIWGDDPGETSGTCTIPGWCSGSSRFDLEVWLVTNDLTVTSDGCCPIDVAYDGFSDEVAAGDTDVFTIPEDTEVLLTAEPPVCCDFVEWVVDGGAPVVDTTISVTMDADHTAVATCTEVGLLTLTVDVVGGGDVEVEGVAPPAYPEEYDYDCCTDVDLEAIPDVGWEFTGWSDDLGGDTNPTTIHMDENKTVTANFAPIGEPQDLTVESDGCCPITVGDLGDVDAGATEVFLDIPFGTEVLLTAEPPVCCDFVEWVVDGGAPVVDTTVTVTMDAEHTAVATCTEVGLLTLTVDVDGEGDVEVNGVAPVAYPEEYEFDCCTDVDLEAIPDVDWIFTGWSGDLGGMTNPTTIHMDENKAITANFAPIGEVYLTVNTTAGGTVTDPGLGTFPYSTAEVVDLVAEPECCFVFDEWTGDVGTVANVNDATTTIMMDDDYEITATFDTGVLLEIDLLEDWNTFATPIALEPCLETLGSLITIAGLDPATDVEIAYYFDGATQMWDVATTGYVMLPCDAIYIDMNTAGSVPICPNQGPTVSAKDMYAGWNLAGSAFINVAGELAVDLALNTLYWAEGTTDPLPQGYSQVISPALNQPGWEYFRDIGVPPNMLVGNGYLVHMDNSDGYGGQTYTPWPMP